MPADTDEAGRRSWLDSPFRRFAVVLPTAIALVVAVVFYPLFLEAEGHIRDQVRAAIALEIVGLDEHFHERGLAGLLDALRRRIDVPSDPAAVYLLTDRAGRTRIGNLAAWPAQVEAIDEHWFHVRHADGSTLEGRVFVLFDGDRLLVGRRSPLEAFQHHIAIRMWVSAALIILVAAVIGARFMQHLHRRLATLAAEAALVQEGHLTQRLSLSPRHDELDELARRFNLAFDEIERLVDAARHVSSAIAHDIRRPLIALCHAIDEARPAAAADAVLDARLSRIGRQTDELLHTFAALLSLARLEAGAHGPAMQTVDLARLMHDVVELYEALATSQGRTLRGTIRSASVRGDADLLFQVLQNLIENALVHGAGGIETRVAPEGTGTVVLAVRDHGEGVDEAALPRLFERFFRADASRSAPAGTGVGLALVKGIVEAHGGTVAARNARPGLEVAIRLPAAGTAPHERARHR